MTNDVDLTSAARVSFPISDNVQQVSDKVKDAIKDSFCGPPSLGTTNISADEEEEEALIMEAYLIALVQRNVQLSSRALLGLRHDLELLSLTDLLCMLQNLFKLVEVVGCRNLTELFRDCSAKKLAEVVKSSQLAMTAPVRATMLSLVMQNKNGATVAASASGSF
eukprot:Gregarina_sp_Poly_1__10623@NODE_796_length_6257_cov_143_075283_g582_i0_p4_GENE_NODE_796_length_6257_cov_143_075283_g582_i0NODE_796_length_6257_cov_143_075283_g582_i0_p4_ORF_typecomplete_len165_score20_12CENPR/PF06729_12/0_16_NODE_796_length_6257_cov_143_075283_g582_i019172411